MHFGELSLINDCQGFRFNRLMSQKKKKRAREKKRYVYAVQSYVNYCCCIGIDIVLICIDR